MELDLGLRRLTIGIAVLGVVVGALICHFASYLAPGMMGMKTGLPLAVVGTSTYGAVGGFLMPGFLRKDKEHTASSETASGRPPEEYFAVLPPKKAEDAGVLAEWDGAEWRIIERHQFTDVTGPGGIHGAPDDRAPLWAVGWDRRSVIVKLLDGGTWSTFRVPKGSYSFDPRHGWFTEWPRIREVDETLDFTPLAEPEEVTDIRPKLEVEPEFAVDAASVVITDRDGDRWRLPRTDPVFDEPFASGWPRGVREVASERNLANFHGIFYEVPRRIARSMALPQRRIARSMALPQRSSG